MSMGHIAISVEHLGKRYRIGQRQTRPQNLREAIESAITAPFHYLRAKLRNPEEDEIIWALKDISFDVKHGEVLGIIGRNGAGKSTLLKILSRITEPTQGQARIYGRVGSLLEVGTGFHPELTGRENIYLNGSILGMRRGEIERRFDEIVAFSGVEKFIDTPVKRYSSGMSVRLAFAVAAHLEPEILLVDEVLAVGDAEFQRKCLGKMQHVSKEGRTVLFISHNMVAVQKLCGKSLWLQEGKLVKQGESQQIVSEYLNSSHSSVSEQSWTSLTNAPGNEILRLNRVCIRPENGLTDSITMQTPFVIEVEFWNLSPDIYLDVTLHIYNEQGIIVLGTGTLQEATWHGKPFPTGLFRSCCHIPGNLMNSGRHSVNVLLVKNQVNLLYMYEEALVFEVADSPEGRGAWYGKLAGAVRPLLDWTTVLLDNKVKISNE